MCDLVVVAPEDFCELTNTTEVSHGEEHNNNLSAAD